MSEAPTTVLVAEDDPDITEIMRLYLEGAGYRVVAATDGLAALEALEAEDVSVALVDLMMPRMNGYDFIRAARRISTCPIIIVSARSMPADKVLGLDVGADGYITKPFDPMEVTAYVRAMLRRTEALDAPRGARDAATSGGAASAGHVLAAGDLALDTKRLVLTRAGAPVALTAAELKIMAQLLAAPGRVFSKAQLYACVSGGDSDASFGGESSVMVHISNIRAKLEDDPAHPRYIATVRGMGYRLDA